MDKSHHIETLTVKNGFSVVTLSVVFFNFMFSILLHVLATLLMSDWVFEMCRVCGLG